MNEERIQILRMISNGKINAEEGLKLLRALEETSEESFISGEEAAEPEAPVASETKGNLDPARVEAQSAVRRYRQCSLWIGLAVTTFSAGGMYALLMQEGLNFWFYCLILPLLLGVALTALAADVRRSRWMFLDLYRKDGQKPARFRLAFPLPFKLASWLWHTFSHHVDLQAADVNEVVEVLEHGLSNDEPLIVCVDDGEDGERVQVYIG